MIYIVAKLDIASSNKNTTNQVIANVQFAILFVETNRFKNFFQIFLRFHEQIDLPGGDFIRTVDLQKSLSSSTFFSVGYTR